MHHLLACILTSPSADMSPSAEVSANVVVALWNLTLRTCRHYLRQLPQQKQPPRADGPAFPATPGAGPAAVHAPLFPQHPARTPWSAQTRPTRVRRHLTSLAAWPSPRFLIEPGTCSSVSCFEAASACLAASAVICNREGLSAGRMLPRLQQPGQSSSPMTVPGPVSTAVQHMPSTDLFAML